jgi:flavin reductase (DIM6/NTAB) family NADH-FMN oxidoreductase RutF
MQIPATDLNALQSYKLLTGVVVPRPIAWITTKSPEGVVNLAPFSAFTYVCAKPPMIGFSCGRKNGKRKDTANNIFASKEFVVHVVDASLLEVMHESSAEHPPEISEPDLLGLEYIPSERVAVPRLTAPGVAMECRFHQSMNLGETGAEFIVGEILLFHVRDDLISNGKIESARLNPVCRLGGPNYALLGQIRTLRTIEQSAQKSLSEIGEGG